MSLFAQIGIKNKFLFPSGTKKYVLIPLDKVSLVPIPSRSPRLCSSSGRIRSVRSDLAIQKRMFPRATTRRYGPRPAGEVGEFFGIKERRGVRGTYNPSDVSFSRNILRSCSRFYFLPLLPLLSQTPFGSIWQSCSKVSLRSSRRVPSLKGSFCLTLSRNVVSNHLLTGSFEFLGTHGTTLSPGRPMEWSAFFSFS